MNLTQSVVPTGEPLFSVIIPYFRARDTVAAAIASVLSQTEPAFELILVDDGSPDDTADIAMAAAGGDRRVRLIRQTNAGPAAARNLGVRQSQGQFLAFLDSDDRWTPDTLARHRDHLSADAELGVSFGQIRFFDGTLTTPGRLSSYVAKLNLVSALGEDPVRTTSNLVTRRSVWREIGGFDTLMTHAEDQEWVVRVLAASNWKVEGIDAELVHYRTSQSGLSSDLDRMDAGWRTMIERARAIAPAEVASAEAAARALFDRFLARRALRTGQHPARALAHLRAAFGHHTHALLRHEPKRTLLTVAGALAAAVLPVRLIRPLITR